MSVLIVGQGIAGSVVALQLIMRRKEIQVFDLPGNNTSSSVAAGIVNPLVFKRMIPGWLAGEALESAKKNYKNIEKLLNKKIWYDIPVSKFLNNNDELIFWKKNKNASAYIGDIIGSTIGLKVEYGIGIVKGSGFINVPEFLSYTETFLKEIGVLKNERFDYDQLKISQGKVHYKGRDYSNVIFCEGTAVKMNPFFNWIPLVPAKGEILKVRIEGLRRDLIYNKNGFLLPIPGKDNEWLAGATFSWSDLEPIPSESGKVELIEKINKMISLDFSIIDQMAGVRPSSIDRRPIIGQHPEYKNLWVLNGFGTKAVLLSPILSLSLLDAIFYKTPIIAEAGISRFL